MVFKIFQVCSHIATVMGVYWYLIIAIYVFQLNKDLCSKDNKLIIMAMPNAIVVDISHYLRFCMHFLFVITQTLCLLR